MKTTFTFPKDFYWGAATASYQVEGGIENCDWAVAAQEGRVPLCGRACGHYSLYEKDFDLAKDLGHNAHRFSIEWARIEPEEGQWDMEAVEHYRQVIAALKVRGMRPYTTLWHFTLPDWFAERGGFEQKDSPEIFARYASFIAKELGTDLEGISTMNEPIVFAGLGWLKGNWPPFKQFTLVHLAETTNSGDRNRAKPRVSWGAFFTYRTVVKNLVRAHQAAYEAIKQIAPDMEVSIVKHVVAHEGNRNPINKLKAYCSNRFQTFSFMNRVQHSCDSIGLNFYHYKKYGDTTEYKKTDMGWEIAPHGIYLALKMLARYKKPIFVSEAGLADADDSDRAAYITEQVRGVARAMRDGVDVRGHMYWSLMDNYEWALGFEKKFGLIEIDYDTLLRKVRPSAYTYKKIIQNNSVTLES